MFGTNNKTDSNPSLSPNQVLRRRRETVGLVLIPLIVLSAYCAWRSLAAAILVPEASPLLAPFLLFSLAIIFFIVGSVLWSEALFALLGTLALFLPSIAIAPKPWHLLFLFLGSVLSFFATRHVQREVRERIFFSFMRSSLLGLPLFILGLSLAIASQYFVHLHSLPWERLVPNFDFGQGIGAWSLRMAGHLYSPLKSLEDSNRSVDDFFMSLNTRERETAPAPSAPSSLENSTEGRELLANLSASAQSLQLLEFHSKLSELLGRPVKGDEKMSAVLAEILRKKTLSVVSSSITVSSQPVPVIPFVLAGLLFLTVYPAGSFLLIVWVALAAIIFSLLRIFHIVALEKRTVDQEWLV